MLELLKRFLPYFKDYKWMFAFAIVGMILTALGSAGAAYMVEPIMNKIFLEKNAALLYLVPFGLVITYMAKSLGKYVQTYFTSYIGQDIVRLMKDKILKNFLSLDISFFYQKHSGELISRITNDTERIRLVVANLIPEMAREILTLIALLGVVIYQSPKLAFFALVVMPLAMYPVKLLAKKVRALSYRAQISISDVTSILSEIFANIELIRVSHTEKFEYKKFKKENKTFFNINMKTVKISELIGPIMETLGSFGAAIVVIVGGSAVLEGSMNTGEFFSFMMALFMLYTPLKRITSIYNRAQDAVAASDRIFQLLNLKSTILSGNKTLCHDIDYIEFKNVSMKYGDKEVLEDINFVSKKSTITALVGNSGGGKSTIVNLIARFYDVSAGGIFFDEVNIKDLTHESLRSNISLVTQKVYIFNDTVANNIAYGMPQDKKKIIQALKDAQALSFVEALPEGIDTVLSEGGSNLSGGQRQRIAIARSLYRDPTVLIFDESTSALDNESEKEILDIIDSIKKDRIIFMIAHRLTTIEDADKIIVLEKGKIVGEGSNKELLENCDKYRKLKRV